jgi:hypothetical protein
MPVTGDIIESAAYLAALVILLYIAYLYLDR